MTDNAKKRAIRLARAQLQQAQDKLSSYLRDDSRDPVPLVRQAYVDIEAAIVNLETILPVSKAESEWPRGWGSVETDVDPATNGDDLLADGEKGD